MNINDIYCISNVNINFLPGKNYGNLLVKNIWESSFLRWVISASIVQSVICCLFQPEVVSR